MEVPFEYASIADHIPGEGTFKMEYEVPEVPAPAKPTEPDLAPPGEIPLKNPALDKVRALLKSEGVTEEEVRKAVGAKGYYPVETSIADYDPSFLEGVVLGAWPQLKAFIDKNK